MQINFENHAKVETSISRLLGQTILQNYALCLLMIYGAFYNTDNGGTIASYLVKSLNSTIIQL